MRLLATYRAHLDGIADSVTFECDGTSSTCANGILTWSCSENCTDGLGCSMDLSEVGLRGTIPAALGDVRCAPWITGMCVHAAACLLHSPAAPPTASCSCSFLYGNTELSGAVPASIGNLRSLKEM
jgi:hypothetical protein